MDVTRQPVQFGNDDRGLVLLGQLHGGGQLRTLVQSIMASAGFDLGESLNQIRPSNPPARGP